MKKILLALIIVILASGCQNTNTQDNSKTPDKQNTENSSSKKGNIKSDTTKTVNNSSENNNTSTGEETSTEVNNQNIEKNTSSTDNRKVGDEKKTTEDYYTSHPMSYSDLEKGILTEPTDDEDTQNKENDNNILTGEKVKYLTCKTITNADFSGELKSNQHFSLGRGQLPFVGGYGEVSNKGRTSYGFENDGMHPIVVMPLDNKKTVSVYLEGEIVIDCGNNESYWIYLPKFKDNKGDGFVDTKGNKFNNGFFVAADGSTYYDKELTKLARKSE